MMKNNFSPAVLSIIAISMILAGCNGGNPGNSAEENISETMSKTDSVTASAAVSETVSEAVSETEEKISESQAEEFPAEKKGYEPYEIKLYNSLGTGIPRPENYDTDRIRYYADGKLEDIISLLKDKDVSAKIASGIKDWFDYLGENYDYSYEQLNDDGLFYTYCDTYNGILFYGKHRRNSSDEPYYAVFDMRTGKRVELSDMFFEGEEFIGELNQKLWEELQKLTFTGEDIYTVDYLPMKREFAGLTENGFYFDEFDFFFPANNPYFTESMRISVSLFDFDTVLNVPYDMTELFADGADEILRFSSADYNFTTSFFKQTGNIDIYFLDESPKLTEKQREFFNNKALSLTEMVDELNQKYGWIAYTNNDEPLYRTHVYDGTEYKYKDFFKIDISVFNGIAQIRFRQDNVYEAPSPDYNLHYDLETFEPLDIEEIFERTFGDEEYVWKYVYAFHPDDTTDMEGFIQGEVPDLSKLDLEKISVYKTEIYFDGRVDDSWVWGSISKKNN